jgi:CRP/FNR family transcriptional regulator, nitrogen fixation regulation protein
MHTQTAIRSNGFRFVPPAANVLPMSPSAARRARSESSEPNSLDRSMYMLGSTMSYARDTMIFSEGESADYVYKVISGSVRTYKILSDGRRQIGRFYLPGDIFDLQFVDAHVFSAEAIADSRVLVVKRNALNGLAKRDVGIAGELSALTSRELRRMQERIMLLIKSAQERLASFLLEMAEYVSSGNAIELPMSRQDIADYLGLTIETVSRTLTALESAAVIELPTSRRITLCNRGALRRMKG